MNPMEFIRVSFVRNNESLSINNLEYLTPAYHLKGGK